MALQLPDFRGIKSVNFHADFAFILEGVCPRRVLTIQRKISEFSREIQMVQNFSGKFVGKFRGTFPEVPPSSCSKQKVGNFITICLFLPFFSLPIWKKDAKPNYNW